MNISLDIKYFLIGIRNWSCQTHVNHYMTGTLRTIMWKSEMWNMTSWTYRKIARLIRTSGKPHWILTQKVM